MLFLYNYLFFVALLAAVPFFLFRMLITSRFRKGLAQRLGFYGVVKNELVTEHSIWIQAASVGEVVAALPVIELLRKEYPDEKIIITCQTASGRVVARKKLAGQAVVILSPLDLDCLIKNLIRLIRPRILILIETEIWPGMIMTARNNRIPVVIVNGRISEGSFRGYRKFIFLVRPLLQMIDAFGMRSENDATRIRHLGAPAERVTVTGNIKFDNQAGPEISSDEKKEIRDALGLKDTDLLLIGGSTYEGEDQILHNVYRQLLPYFPDLKLLLAPRHLERINRIEAFLHSREEEYSRYAVLTRQSGQRKKTGVVILDVLGVLSNLYALATVAFIGRSLRGIGGQNPIEPALIGCPVVFGPHMENFQEIADNLIKAGGAVKIVNEIELKQKLSGLLSNPEERQRMGERAQRAIVDLRGASQRNLKLIISKIN